MILDFTVQASTRDGLIAEAHKVAEEFYEFGVKRARYRATFHYNVRPLVYTHGGAIKMWEADVTVKPI